LRRVQDQRPGLSGLSHFHGRLYEDRESFRNAAKFLGARTNVFDAASSSFNKNESITDAIKMLYGYSRFLFRNAHQAGGTCRWLEQALARYAELSENSDPASSMRATESTSTQPRNYWTSFPFSSTRNGRKTIFTWR
jgi:hypothetical protein